MGIQTMEFAQTKLSFGRSLTSYGKVQSIISYLIRNRRLFADLKEHGCYVDLGCGANSDTTFCNIDYSWDPGIDICWDVTRGLPFSDGYVGGIFTEHMLEHIPFESALFLLKECRRVLRKGGVMRIVMPDGALYLKEYERGERAKMPHADGDIERYPFVTPMISINRIFREHGHCFIWDFPTLRNALSHAGFETIKACSFRRGKDNLLLRDSAIREVESFYTEAY